MLRFLIAIVSGIVSFLLWIGNAVSRWKSLPSFVRGLSVAVVVVVVGILGYGGFQVFSYSQNDPNFCRSCHTMETAWAKWSTSEHKNVNCHSCHEQSPIESMNLVVEFALNNPTRVVKHASISDEACLKCHGTNNSRWFQIADTPGHLVHFEDQAISCVKCHSTSIHRFSPPSTICQVCHANEQMKITAMGQNHCLDCHQFLKRDVPHNATKQGTILLPTRQTCLGCHLNQSQSKVTWPTNAPMQFECYQCHQPHVSQAPTVNCVSCHEAVPKEGLHQAKTHSQQSCQGCHKPHEWVVSSRDACTACHADKQNHNQGGLCINCHNFKQQASQGQQPGPGRQLN